MLIVKNLHASIQGKEIVKGVTFEVKPGEVHAIMGPNGSGKSTFAKALAGEPSVEITQGEIIYKGEDLLKKSPDERALAGVFMGFQYPVEIPGVKNASFLRMAFNARRKVSGKEEMDPLEFDEYLMEKLKIVNISGDFLTRAVNVGFSGGEKKKNEILQMAVLDPELAILDETDSGLDIDSLRMVASSVNRLRSPQKAMVLVTHYQRILNYIEPDYVHIFCEGRIICSSSKQLAREVEDKGYDWLISQNGKPDPEG